MIKESEALQLQSEFDGVYGTSTKRSTADEARQYLDAWDHLLSIMERENNFSNKLGSDIIDWQIGNWANDLTVLLMNARLYENLIRVNEQILKISWNRNDNLFHENAMREIADAYADLGNKEKCYELYEQYLEEDPLWGWAWIGYWRQLNDHDDERFPHVLDQIYTKIKNGEPFRDKEDLCRELADEFERLGEYKKTRKMRIIEEKAKKKPSQILTSFITPTKKVGRNEPCPCGSGKKYKHCCGRKMTNNRA